GGRQGLVRRPVRKVLTAGEKAQERSADPRSLVADGAAQDRVGPLERVEERIEPNCAVRAGRDVEIHLGAGAGQDAQVIRHGDSDHGSVWASTLNTGGRSRAMAFQLSPPSAEA